MNPLKYPSLIFFFLLLPVAPGIDTIHAGVSAGEALKPGYSPARFDAEKAGNSDGRLETGVDP